MEEFCHSVLCTINTGSVDIRRFTFNCVRESIPELHLYISISLETLSGLTIESIGFTQRSKIAKYRMTSKLAGKLSIT